MKNLLSTSPLVVAKDMVADKDGRPLATVRRPRVLFGGWLRWALYRHRAKSFDLVDPAGGVICHVDEGGLRIRLTVTGADGAALGTVTTVRTGRRSAKYVLTGADGSVLGEGRFITKVKYGDIPKKLTHAFDDASGNRVATADQKPGGGPHQVRFQGNASEIVRLLALSFVAVLPGGRLASDPPRPLATAGAAPAAGVFAEPALTLHRDRVLAPDGRTLATVREPNVPLTRGLSRAMSHNPQTTAYAFEVAEPAGEPLFVVRKSAGAVNYDVEVTLPDGTGLGSIKRSGGVAKAAYTVTGRTGAPPMTIAATGAFSSDYEVLDGGGSRTALLNRVQAVDEPWQIQLAPHCDAHARMLVVAFAVVQELMLDL